VLRRVFGNKMNVVKGDWIKLHIEEPNDLYYSSDVMRVTDKGR
jgi:hypothetical protein